MIKKTFLFPGQGAQYVGMGKKLCEKYEIAKRTFDEADEVLGFSLSNMCFNGDITELTKTQNAQPAILTVSVAMFRVLLEKNIVPDILVGHSLGEISALTCAGAIPFADAVRLARKRGELMQEAVPHGEGAMAAVMTRDIEMLKNLCDEISSEGKGIVSIANYNSHTQQVISGNVGAVNSAVEKLKVDNIQTKLLNVSGPFHCMIMKPAADKFSEILATYNFGELKYPVLANINALPYAGTSDIKDNLTAQIFNPVRWTDSMTYLKKAMTNYCVEVGPGHVLKNMMKTNVSDIPVYAFDSDEDKLYQHVERTYFPFVSRAMGIAVATKNINWDEESYNKGVVEPYNEMKILQAKIENEGRKANEDEMKKTIKLLHKIFVTKGTPIDEQKSRFFELFADSGQQIFFKDFDINSIE